MNENLTKVVQTTTLDQSSLNNIVESSHQHLIFFAGAERSEDIQKIGIYNRNVYYFLLDVANIIVGRYLFGFFVGCPNDTHCRDKTRRVVARPEVGGDSFLAIVEVVFIEELCYFIKGFLHLEEVGNELSRLFPLFNHIIPVFLKGFEKTVEYELNFFV